MDKETLDQLVGTLGEIKEGTDANSTQMTDMLGRLDDVEAKLKNGDRGVSLPGLEDQVKEFSFQRAILGAATGDWSQAGFEKEVFDETKKRTLIQGSDPAGGYLVPNQILADFIDLLRSKTVVKEMGATVMSGLIGSPVEIMRQTSGSTAYWVAENTDITASEQTFGELTMAPKQLSAMTKMSNRLLRMSNPSVEGLVRNDLAKVLARALDLSALRGTGSASEPLGIANTAGINTHELATNGQTPTVDDLYDTLLLLEEDDVELDGAGWVFTPRTWNSLRKLKDGQSNYLLQNNTQGWITDTPATNAVMGTLLGMPFRTTTQIPNNLTVGTSDVCSEMYFGNWSEVMVGEWFGLQFAASQETSDAFSKNSTWVRLIQEVDVAVRQPLALCLVTGVLA